MMAVGAVGWPLARSTCIRMIASRRRRKLHRRTPQRSELVRWSAVMRRRVHEPPRMNARATTSAPQMANHMGSVTSAPRISARRTVPGAPGAGARR